MAMAWPKVNAIFRKCKDQFNAKYGNDRMTFAADYKAGLKCGKCIENFEKF